MLCEPRGRGETSPWLYLTNPLCKVSRPAVAQSAGFQEKSYGLQKVISGQFLIVFQHLTQLLWFYTFNTAFFKIPWISCGNIVSMKAFSTFHLQTIFKILKIFIHTVHSAIYGYQSLLHQIVCTDSTIFLCVLQY